MSNRMVRINFIDRFGFERFATTYVELEQRIIQMKIADGCTITSIENWAE